MTTAETPDTTFKPATDELVGQLRRAAVDYALGFDEKGGGGGGHENLWGLNLTSFMGERMGVVIARLDTAEAENERLRAALHLAFDWMGRPVAAHEGWDRAHLELAERQVQEALSGRAEHEADR